MSPCYVAVDIGASSGRVIVGELCDGAVSLTEVHRFPNGVRRVDGSLCWDVDALWESVLAGLRAVGRAGYSPSSIGVDTWAVDFVLLDDRGRRVGDAVSYRDERTDGIRERLEREGVISFAEHYGRTGIQFQRFNTAYQLVALARKHPEQLARARSLLMIPDYLNYLLTGVSTTEYTNASTTALVSASTRTWDDELVERLGLPRSILMPISEPGTEIGRLRPEVASFVGFDCPVVLPATHDTGSAWLAVPARDERTAYLSSGTWSLMGVERHAPVVTAESLAANLTNEGGYAGTFRCLKNIMGLWMIQRVRSELAEEGRAPSWGELVDAAEAARAAGFSATVDVDDPRFLAPESMVSEVRDACSDAGEHVPRSAGELALVVYDSLAAAYARTVDELGLITGTTLTAVNVVGGGSSNAYLNQATANACGLPVFAGPTEGTALGNVLVQIIASGEVADLRSARDLISNSFDIKEVKPQ